MSLCSLNMKKDSVHVCALNHYAFVLHHTDIH